jgi:hypothetical protein
MTGISAVGQSPVASAPLAYGTAYEQSVNVTIVVSPSILINVNKIVNPAIDLVVSQTRAIAFTVGAGLSLVTSVTKAVAFQTAVAHLTLASIVFKNALKSIRPMPVQVSSSMLRNIGKIVNPIIIKLPTRLSGAGLFVTSREILQNAVDYVLAGTQPLKSTERVWEKHDPNIRSTTTGVRSGVRNLGGEKPSFTVKSGPPKRK